MMRLILSVLLVTSFAGVMQYVSGLTSPQDVSALRSLSNGWKNVPPSWRGSTDPCDNPWEGISCSNSRVTKLILFNMGLQGILNSYIGNLTELQFLDLSYNTDLGGSLPASIGNLLKLQTLRLIGCKFNSPIPSEIGNLINLDVLALNSNQFSGDIPASIGKLSKVSWLDLADNQLTGTLPTSSNSGSGLDQLVKAQHFHFNKNQLSGSIPADLFNSELVVIHVLLDNNNLGGQIPESVGQLKSLEVLRLDRNHLNGSVPASINNLTNLDVLNLANNKLTGSMPNMTGMLGMSYLDLSNNSFDPSVAPAWFSDLQSLTTLVIESGGLHGEVPQTIFSFGRLEEVRLGNNSFNGTLDIGKNFSHNLNLINFQNNDLDSVTFYGNYNGTLLLTDNPVCSTYLAKTTFCLSKQQSPTTSLPENDCSHPYEGHLIFRAPYFSEVQNYTSQLKQAVDEKLKQFPVSHDLTDFRYNNDGYLQVLLTICPKNETYFTRTQILEWFDFNSQIVDFPPSYGPYYPIFNLYIFENNGNQRWIIGVSVAAGVLAFLIFCIAVYAHRQKKRANKAIALTNPFASWGSNGADSGDAPQLKGAKFFSFEEMRICTNNFSSYNIIGAGGYGDVYKGLLSDGQVVAIKRSKEGSSQGGLEFKTEIELLSRVHHKNLVELVGFCFEKGERMLVYQYISNGTLRDNLSGGTKQLDWKRRIKIALDSAKGLTYLHENANPPIIHRDVKSTNILLDENFTAKVADFGLSKLVMDSELGTVSVTVKGTLGYLDPEYYMTHQLTGKSDVYSFGVVMLELVTGRLPIEKNKYVVREVKMALDKSDNEYYGLKNLIDPVLLNTRYLEGFHKFVDLALQCVEELGENRPTMNELVKEIEMILKNGRTFTNSTSDSSSSTDFRNFDIGPKYNYKEFNYYSNESTSRDFTSSDGNIFSSRDINKGF